MIHAIAKFLSYLFMATLFTFSWYNFPTNDPISPDGFFSFLVFMGAWAYAFVHEEIFE